MSSKRTPKPIEKARKKISDIESQYSIDTLKDNHNNYKNIEQRIKRGKTGLSNDYSKSLYLLYCTYLKAFDKVQKYNKKNNIDPSPTTIISTQSSILVRIHV